MEGGGTHGKIPYIPPITERDPTAGLTWILLMLAFIGALAYGYLSWQRKRNRERRLREGHLDYSYHSSRPNATRFVDTRPKEQEGSCALKTGQQLTVTFPDNEVTFNATVINVSDENFVITLPKAEAEGKTFTPANGEQAQFFLVRNELHCTFKTTVLQVFSGGLRACSFRHTGEVMISNRRGSARVSGDSPALFTVIPRGLIEGEVIPLSDLRAELSLEIPGVIEDISEGGCALRTRSPIRFHAGDLVLFSACLPETTKEISALAGVLSVRPQTIGQGGGSLLSLEFLAPEEKMLELISGHVAQRIEEEVIA